MFGGMRERSLSLSRRRWPRLLRLAACLLVAGIGADLVGDAGCDVPSFLGSKTSAIGLPSQANSEDACALYCVPDCFCCSRSVAAGGFVLMPELGPLTHLDLQVTERPSAGVPPVVDHPPLHLS